MTKYVHTWRPLIRLASPRVSRLSLATRRPELVLSVRSLTASQLQHFTTSPQCQNVAHFLPPVLRPSFWRSLFPRFKKQEDTDDTDPSKKRKRPWNPATFFIYIFLFIGSQAIQMIALRKNFAEFSRETETRLDLLREVIRRVQNGEDVDIDGMLGTGKKKEERAWEDVIRELEEEDAMIRERALKRDRSQAHETSGNDQN